MTNNVGKSTVGDRVKSAHRKLVKSGERISLKKFAHNLVAQGKKEKSEVGKDAQDWLDAKSGTLNLKRSTKTESRIAQEKIAKKSGKSKK